MFYAKLVIVKKLSLLYNVFITNKKEKNMNIGFDIDDTLTNGKFYAKKFYEEYKKISQRNLDEKKKTHFVIKAYLSINRKLDEALHNFKQQFLKEMPISEDAKLVLEKLKQEGHTVFVITKRFSNKPYKRSIKLLKDNDLPYDKLIINAGNKLQACKNNNIDLFIDNSVSICDNLNKNGVNAYLITTYFNKHKKTISPRVNSLTEFLEIVLNYQKEAEIKELKTTNMQHN